MAQTVDAMNSADAVLEVSSDNSTWKSISGSSVSVTPGAQTRSQGQTNTLEGTDPIVLVGRKGPLPITIVGVFTTTADEAFEVLKAIWATTTGTVYLRINPEGTTAGGKRLITGKATLQSFQYPPFDANSANPVTFQAVVQATGLTEEVIPTA